jgi:hypothetical protein
VHRVSDLFRATLVVAAVDSAGERHLAVLDCYHDLKSVEVIILAEPIVDVFSDALVGAAIILWSTSGTLVHAPAALGVFITKPRSDRV